MPLSGGNPVMKKAGRPRDYADAILPQGWQLTQSPAVSKAERLARMGVVGQQALSQSDGSPEYRADTKGRGWQDRLHS